MAFKVGPVKVSPVVLNILVILGFVSPHGLIEYSPMIASSSWVNTFLKIIETIMLTSYVSSRRQYALHGILVIEPDIYTDDFNIIISIVLFNKVQLEGEKTKLHDTKRLNSY